MLSRFRAHCRQQFVGYIAIFIALGGTSAYAANTVFSSDIVDGEVKTQDLGGGAVQSSKVADGAIGSAKVADNSLTGADILGNSLRGQEIKDGGLTGADVGFNSLKGAHIDESTLRQVPSALLGGLGRYSDTAPACDPESTAFISCASTTIELPAATSVLVIGTVKAQGGGTGQCQLILNGPNIFTTMGALSGFDAGNGIDAKFVPLIAVTPDGRRGSNKFEIECKELSGEQIFYDARVVAVALSPS